VASVDESAITGESALLIREAGGDRSGVTGGTRVLSDSHHHQDHGRAGKSFLDRMIASSKGPSGSAPERNRPVARALGFTLIFLIVTAALWPMASMPSCYMQKYLGIAERSEPGDRCADAGGLLVCPVIPTTIGRPSAAIGIAGMDRGTAGQYPCQERQGGSNSPAISIRCFWTRPETITVGNRRADAVRADGRVYGRPDLGRLAALASVADQTPEGKSIVDLYQKMREKAAGTA